MNWSIFYVDDFNNGIFKGTHKGRSTQLKWPALPHARPLIFGELLQEILQTSRPINHRSPPASFNPLSLTSSLRQPHSRTNSHTAMTSRPMTQDNRVRRKSLVSNGPNRAAVAAAACRAELVPALPMNIGSPRRASKSGGLRPDLASLGNMPLQAASVPAEKYLGLRGGATAGDDAVDDQEYMLPGESESLQVSRDRRASDGQPLNKEGRKFNRPVITCPYPGCLKQYKHNSCLEKHKSVALVLPRPEMLLAHGVLASGNTWSSCSQSKLLLTCIPLQMGTH